MSVVFFGHEHLIEFMFPTTSKIVLYTQYCSLAWMLGVRQFQIFSTNFLLVSEELSIDGQV